MSHYRQAMKEQKKKEITSLLALAGLMEAKSIIKMGAVVNLLGISTR